MGSFGTPWGTSRCRVGHRRSVATTRNRGSGLTATAWPTADSNGDVVHAVGVGIALGEVDPVALRPLPHGVELAGRPHEVAGDRAVVGAVGVDAVARGDHIVETEQIGERTDEVVRGGGGEHERPPRQPMLGEELGGVRLDERDEAVGDGFGGELDGGLGLALGQGGALAGDGHRRQRLPHHVEQAVHEVLARYGPTDEAGDPHRVREHLAAGAGEQRPVEIEERSTLRRRGGGVGHERHRRGKRERRRWGSGASQPGTRRLGEPSSWVLSSRSMGDGSDFDRHVKVCT